MAESRPRARRRTVLRAALAAAASTAVAASGALSRLVPGARLKPRPVAASSLSALDIGPSFSDVAQVGPNEAADYFAGRHPRYPGAALDSYLGFSAADIVEPMDTAVLDGIGRALGAQAVDTIELIVARNLLEALLFTHGRFPVVLALDAGHGGNPEVYYDPGSNGTEAYHTRKVVAAAERLAQDRRFATITIRRIFNEAIGDDFGLPSGLECRLRTSLVLRNARASMLAFEAGQWSQAHPERPAAVHVVSVHFDANSGGSLVLHQGDEIPPTFRDRSVTYARTFVNAVNAELNQSGLLPGGLRFVGGTGLHNDQMMYTTPLRGGPINPLTGANREQFPDVYGMLQGSLLEQDYLLGVLRYRGFA